MPTKPNRLSNATKPLVDSHEAGRPAKGFKQVVARLAKPFKGLGSVNDRAAKALAAKELSQASNHASTNTPSPQMLAQAREQADSLIARMSSCSTSDRVFATPKFSSLNDLRCKLLDVRQLVLDTEIQLHNRCAQLNSSSAPDQENTLKIRFEILKLEKILGDAKALKTDYSARLDKAFTSEFEKIQSKIDGFQHELVSSSGSRKLHLKTLITQAEVEKLNLKIARDGV